MITTFEQAKKLRELGYRGETRFVYTPYLRAGEKIHKLEDGIECYKEPLKDWNSDTTNQLSAPSVSEALDWIREEKGIDCCVFYNNELLCDKETIKAIYYFKYGRDGKTIYNSYNVDYKSFDTHPLAESALLDSVLIHFKVEH